MIHAQPAVHLAEAHTLKMIIELPRGSLGESTFERQQKFVPTIQEFATKDAQSVKRLAILIFLIDTNLAKGSHMMCSISTIWGSLMLNLVGPITYHGYPFEVPSLLHICKKRSHNKYQK